MVEKAYEKQVNQQTEFLTVYRQQFLSSLDVAIETVVKHKYNCLAKKRVKKNSIFTSESL